MPCRLENAASLLGRACLDFLHVGLWLIIHSGHMVEVPSTRGGSQLSKAFPASQELPLWAGPGRCTQMAEQEAESLQVPWGQAWGGGGDWARLLGSSGWAVTPEEEGILVGRGPSTGKGSERGRVSFDVQRESVRGGRWRPRGSRSVHALQGLGQTNTCNTPEGSRR